MSFLRHEEIYPSDGGVTRLNHAPPLIVWMSFRLAIPSRVALPHCPLPLHQPVLSMLEVVLPVDSFSSNGQLCLNYLC